jgi:hypothetical protein
VFRLQEASLILQPFIVIVTVAGYVHMHICVYIMLTQWIAQTLLCMSTMINFYTNLAFIHFSDNCYQIYQTKTTY